MRVVICGAGIAGLALARCLDGRGWAVTVLERAPAPRPGGYMIDFFGPGYDAAEAMGVLPRVRAVGYRVHELSYVDAAGRRRAGLSFDRFAGMVDGRLVSVLRPDLERVLRESLTDRVDLRFGAWPERIDTHDDGVRVRCADGAVLDADLLVGADGLRSSVRPTVVDGPDPVRHLGFHTAAFVFDDPVVRAAVGDRFCLTDTVDRQMGFYGLRDGRVAAFTVHRAASAPPPRDARAALRDTYGGLGWMVPRALAACPPAAEVYYDQVAQVDAPVWSRGRVVLVGDAAYAVSLLAGQGASLAVAGAYVLADRLARAGTVAAALRDYERLLRPVVDDRQRAGRAAVRWFLPHSRADLRLRRVALGLARLPGVDRFVGTRLTGKASAVVREVAGAR